MAGIRGSSSRAWPRRFLGSLVVAVGVGGLGVQDQPAGGDLLVVLLPQVGAGGVQGGGLVGELPGGAQVSGPVGLVGGHGRAVGPHARAVVLRGGGPAILALTWQVVRRRVAADPLAHAGRRRFLLAACPRGGRGWRLALRGRARSGVAARAEVGPGPGGRRRSRAGHAGGATRCGAGADRAAGFGLAVFVDVAVALGGVDERLLGGLVGPRGGGLFGAGVVRAAPGGNRP